MPRVKKCNDISPSQDVDEKLPTIQTMQFVDSVDAQREADEREAFDAVSLLEEMFPDKPKHERTCPLCHVELLYDEVTTKRGDVWCYYRCPSVTDFTKCFIASGEADVDMYLHRVKQSLHPVFQAGADSFHSSHMRCYCQRSLILALSKSDKNKHRLYFKCPKGDCSFFQWADVSPVGKVQRWLRQGVNPDAKGKEQRHQPYDLAKPIPRQRPFEARTRR